ncbi:alpha/beta fold hydrolase [Streptomyces sp. TLI_146]|uniref:alpha/beta fold hydrolase n=1 Tax=Streptomyces sp. TLI_146 TaxID=1938858 RepID=UPI000C7127CA|nr:alpha/beta hydrolase [Streptomyces sp. TLI_146]PKV83108.1 pimeloyl-ACP methyl ester carboxylesterase [Streptomyces sp. TLI_146]
MHPTRRTLTLAAVLPATLVALGAAAPVSHSAAAADRHGSRPTIVLVHGAFADASSWNGTIRRLQRAGYPVLAPANPLRGLAADTAYLRSALDAVDGPVVLVGHSYGGAVISGAAVGDSRVKALVYIAAFTPDKGESAGELAAKFPGSTLGDAVNPRSYPLPGGGTGSELVIERAKFPRQFAADVPGAEAAVMAATQRPVATAALEEKAQGAAWKTIPSWALVATADKNIPPVAERWMARRAGSHITEVDASHAVAVSRPAVVTDVILDAVRATR